MRTWRRRHLAAAAAAAAVGPHACAHAIDGRACSAGAAARAAAKRGAAATRAAALQKGVVHAPAVKPVHIISVFFDVPLGLFCD